VSKVRIVQLLCPQRHCIMALPYESPNGEEQSVRSAALRLTFTRLVEEKTLNPWCELCKSRELFCEDMPTKFATMDEAKAPLLAQEAAQMATQLMIKGSKN
jgi:hypothetical protein